MFSLVDKRFESFQTASTGIGRKGSKKSLWPYTNQHSMKKLLDGDFLSKLGFYYLSHTKDTVICHFCESECQWSQEFNHPLSFHLSNDPCAFSLAWAVACSKDSKVAEILGLDEFADLLGNADYHSLLLDTFENWPRKAPSAVQMAEAGFCFQPMTDSPDHSTCLFCKSSLDGWEKNDDPVAEHRKRSAECVFFIDFFQGQEEPQSAAPATKSVSKKGKAADGVKEIAEEAVATAPLKTRKGPMKRTTKEKPAPATTTVKPTADAGKPDDAADPDVQDLPKKRGGRKKAVPTEEIPAARETVEENSTHEAVEKKRPIKKKKAPAVGTRKGRSATKDAHDEATEPMHDQVKDTDKEMVDDALLEEEVEVAVIEKLAVELPKRGRKKKVVAEKEEDVVDVDVPVSAVEEVKSSKKRSLAEDDEEEASVSIEEPACSTNKRGKKDDPKKGKAGPKKKAAPKKNPKKKTEDKENQDLNILPEEDPETQKLVGITLQPSESFIIPSDASPRLSRITQQIIEKTNLSEKQLQELYEENLDMPSEAFFELIGEKAVAQLDKQWTKQMEEIDF